MAKISFLFFMVFTYHMCIPRFQIVDPVCIPKTKSVYPVIFVLRTISTSGTWHLTLLRPAKATYCAGGLSAPITPTSH